MSASFEITTLEGDVETVIQENDGRMWRTEHPGSHYRSVDENFTWLRGRHEKDSPTLHSLQVAWALVWQHLWPWP